MVNLPARDKLAIKRWAEAGGTVYLRGPLEPGHKCTLAPLVDAEFECSIHASAGYRFSKHWILPVALAGENTVFQKIVSIAGGLPPGALPLVMSMDNSGHESPIIFAIEVGAGIVICDLTEEIDEAAMSLIAGLSDPRTRPAYVGALAAIDYAGGRDVSLSAPVNLVIDDRPINHDFFNCGRTERFLRHLDARCPGIHTDFAWTPDQTRVHHRYVDILRNHNTGYVWHGFMRHLDHRSIMDLETDLKRGRKLIDEIVQKYDVRIQPVMIFPYEKDSPVCDELLKRSDFIAKVQSFDPDINAVPRSYFRLRSTRIDRPAPIAQFNVLLREEETKLTRDRMLALAALGLPIIALAHPNNLGVQRFRPTLDSMGPTYFDRVLRFASEKSLRPMSLENIANEMPVE